MTARRGMALLVVLAVTVLTVSALLLVARAISAATMARHTSMSTMVADDLVRAADVPIRSWLASEAPEIVLPPDAVVPSVPVLHDKWTAGDVEVELVITAWDQCGMVPADAFRGPLRAAVTDQKIHGIVAATKVPRGQAAGLDLFLAAAKEVEGARVYPTVPPDEQLEQDDDEPQPLAVGEVVATHNPAPGRINVNTAPIALVEAAMRRAGRGGLDPLIEARSAGERFDPPAPPRQRRGRGGAPQLAGTSDAWAYRVDITVGGMHRSWWCVYRRLEPGKPWECVQRLAILD